MIRLAVVGCGRRAAIILEQLLRFHPEVKLSVVVDPNEPAVRKSLHGKGIDPASAVFVPDVEDMLDASDRVDAVLIGTRCHLHTPMAIKAARLGVPVMLEKPVAINREQFDALAAAYAGREDSVVVSFPLRTTPIIEKVREIIRSGRLGAISQLQAVNNVPYGGVYFGSWYRNHDQSGDLWLQKATHDLDYITHLLDSRPEQVMAMESRTVFGGNMPEGLTCRECDRAEACLESPITSARRGDGGVQDHACYFGRDIRHHDAASAMVRYASGAHASYVQNFVARRGAERRGATIIGYRATLSFDFYSQSITVTDHHSDAVEQIQLERVRGHFGGDEPLIASFVNVIRGEAPSPTPLSDGLRSAAMCLAAGESCRTGMAQPIVMPSRTRARIRSDAARIDR